MYVYKRISRYMRFKVSLNRLTCRGSLARFLSLSLSLSLSLARARALSLSLARSLSLSLSGRRKQMYNA